MEKSEKIKYALKETNGWWKGDGYSNPGYSPREIYPAIQKYAKLRQIIALVGLRRTGKTTLMLRMVEDYLNELPPKNILYFSFDDFASLEMEDLLVFYKELFPELNIREGRFLFCFDEIQKLNNWQDKVKRLYDLYPNIKIVVSGSETLFIRKEAKESLGGRIFEFRLSPLTFREYLIFRHNEKLIGHPELYTEDIIRAYKKYIRSNGFPELAHVEDDAIIHKYLKETVVDKILFKDIPQLFKVKNVDLLSEILDLIVYGPGQIIDISRLSKEIGLTRQAVSSYLDYLEKAFLVKKLYNFSRNLRKQKRALKKYYPAIMFPGVIDDKFALCFENSMIWQLDAQFFYRDAYHNEVDAILLGDDKKPVPIEIKTGRADFKGLTYFMKKFHIKEGLVISMDKQVTHGNIKVIPFYKALFTPATTSQLKTLSSQPAKGHQ